MGKPAQDDTRTSVVTTDHGEAGRIEVDRQGNRVWRWARDVLDSTSILLKRLDNHDLALEATQKMPVGPAAKSGSPQPAKADAKPAKRRERTELSVEPEPGRRDSGGGFDPYNSRR